MMYDLSIKKEVYVYGHKIGSHWGILGTILVLTPLISIPAFILISQWKVSDSSFWPISVIMYYLLISDLNFDSVVRAWLYINCILLAVNQNPNTMTTPSSDLRQARPDKPILTLCKKAIFKAQLPPNRPVEENKENREKREMEEPMVWWSLINRPVADDCAYRGHP